MSDRLVAEMREIFLRFTIPPYLNATAIQLLADGRQHFTRIGLREVTAIPEGTEWLLFPWTGTAGLTTLVLALKLHGVTATPDEITVSISAKDAEAARTALEAMAIDPPPTGERLATQFLDLSREKFDRYLSPELLLQNTASAYLQPERLPEIARSLLAGWQQF